jgi:uncharacterized protein YxeA
MKKVLVLLVTISAFIGIQVMAHEGHNHDSPKGLVAPKGGAIKSLEETNIEVLSKGNDLKIYLYDAESKEKSTAGFVITATAELPRNRKKQEVILTAKENSFEATYDAKGSHRYTLHLSVKDPKTGHNDKLQFIIEPHK